jgi:hypothetical protein
VWRNPTSRERIGDKLLKKLNCVVVPMVERADPLAQGQILQGVMSNPVGMYVCVCVVCVCVHTHTHTHKCVCTHLCVCLCV